MKKIVAFVVEAFCVFIFSKLITKGYLTKAHEAKEVSVSSRSNSSYDYSKRNVTCEELGVHTWTVLHSVAAAYANYPNETEKRNVERVFNGLMHVYPSRNTVMKEIVEDTPLEHGSREELVYYLCDIHNQMNKVLGKKRFPCKNAFDIWGGDCGCNTNN